MTLAAARRCPLCGLTGAVDSVGGQCPRCLIGVALGDPEGLTGTLLERDGPAREFGDYLLGPQIGAGGMGVVYDALRLRDDQRVALKLIRDFHVASPALLRRFTIEAEAVARLEHPNIVRIHEVGECEGHPFFSMELIEGGSLGERIVRGPADDLRAAAGSMAAVARAVQHAHDRGVLHRDIKPGNILVDSRGELLLTDFGLAKLLQPDAADGHASALTSSGAPGTPSYMSPEQVLNGDVTRASDIYALGAVLYALLTGRPPFHGPTPLELFQQIAAQPAPAPRTLNPAVPADLETICLKCLEKNPRHRYATAAALAEDLENFSHGRRIQARPASWARRSWQWSRRNPAGTAFMASLCLGLFVAVALLKVVNDQRREMELDRDQTFDEGMQKVSQIWRDPATRFVTVSARELAILAGRSPADSRGAKFELTLAVSADDGPSSVAQRYARLLGGFQEEMLRELGEKTVFHLRLLKRFNRNEATLAAGEADLLVLNAVDYLRAEATTPGIRAIAHANSSRQGVIFARTNSGIHRWPDVRGKSLVLPDPGLSLTVWAQARLVQAGWHGRDFRAQTNLVDRQTESGLAVISPSECIDSVLKGEWDVGVTHRGQFERYQHLGLVALDTFPETPNILAARAGLDPRLIEALQKVLRGAEGSSAWPESRFLVLEAEAPPPGAKSPLDSLRSAMDQAAQF